MGLRIHNDLCDRIVPTQDTRPLAVIVERIVRPLNMRAHRRWRVRNDLMAHLMAIRDEERAAGGDEKAMLARTIARFGDPAALSMEIGSQTTWWEKRLVRLEGILNRRPRESFESFAIRMMAMMLGMMFFIAIFVLIFDPARRFAWPVMARTFALVSIYVTAMIYTGVKIFESLGRSRLRAPLWLVCLALLYPAFHICITGHTTIAAVDWASQWPQVTWGTLVTLALGTLGGWAFHREFDYELAWANVAVE